MKYEKKEVKIFILSGKARSGKDTSMEFIKKYYKECGLKVLNLGYSYYLKEYVKVVSDWDGRDETKPREFLQELGTSIIREKIDENFFINRMVEDIKVYSYFFDVFIISDARIINEIEVIKNNFSGVISINIVRPGYDNGLSNDQKNHLTEVGLDGYKNFDYEIINNGTLEELEEKIINVIKEVIL